VAAALVEAVADPKATVARRTVVAHKAMAGHQGPEAVAARKAPEGRRIISDQCTRH
jgi:hypothetical protein